MAQRLQQELVRRHPQVDLVIGSGRSGDLPAFLAALEAGQGPVVAAGHDRDADRLDTPPRRSGQVNAWVPVMRGCDHACTYCIVPTTRGPEVSRPPVAIETEVRQAVNQGFVQVTLLGQTVDAYQAEGSDLADLLLRLEAIDGLLRIRFVTSHPDHISERLLQVMAGSAKIARHLHLPVQSGSDRILAAMARGYTRTTYRDLVERARRIVPGLELLTDLIVGFPGETDQDFQATLALMDEVHFDGAFVFQYNPRPGTPAAHLVDDVPKDVKRQRCQSALAKQLAWQEAHYTTLAGSLHQVLLEGPSKSRPDRLAGRSEGNLNVVIPRQDPDGQSRDRLIGCIVPVRLAGSTNLTLLGELV